MFTSDYGKCECLLLYTQTYYSAQLKSYYVVFLLWFCCYYRIFNTFIHKVVLFSLIFFSLLCIAYLTSTTTTCLCNFFSFVFLFYFLNFSIFLWSLLSSYLYDWSHFIVVEFFAVFLLLLYICFIPTDELIVVGYDYSMVQQFVYRKRWCVHQTNCSKIISKRFSKKNVKFNITQKTRFIVWTYWSAVLCTYIEKKKEKKTHSKKSRRWDNVLLW